MKKALSIMLLVAMVVGILSGCTSQPAEPVNPAPSGTDSGEKPLKVAILLKTLSNPFWVDMAEGIKAEAKNQGVEVEVFAVESEADIDGQLKKFEDIINSGAYDGIGIAPITGTNLISGVVAANKKGIPVVNIDAKIDEAALKAAGGYIVGFATSDNFKVGEMGAQYLIDTIGAEGGKIAIIEGRAGDLSGELRRDGAKSIIEKTANFSVADVQPADWDRQKALDVATNIIAKTPDLKGIFVANDTMALGALQAISNTGKTGQIHLVGTDASDETKEAIKAGNMTAVVQSPANIGATCFGILVDAIKAGEKGSLDYEVVTKLVEANLVTKENVK